MFTSLYLAFFSLHYPYNICNDLTQKYLKLNKINNVTLTANPNFEYYSGLLTIDFSVASNPTCSP